MVIDLIFLGAITLLLNLTFWILWDWFHGEPGLLPHDLEILICSTIAIVLIFAIVIQICLIKER